MNKEIDNNILSLKEKYLYIINNNLTLNTFKTFEYLFEAIYMINKVYYLNNLEDNYEFTNEFIYILCELNNVNYLNDSKDNIHEKNNKITSYIYGFLASQSLCFNEYLSEIVSCLELVELYNNYKLFSKNKINKIIDSRKNKAIFNEIKDIILEDKE